ncbi:MAG: MFS transporter [Actinobacteria bacterium]|nr:MFS transporter [Actinomycetota bacterium]
MRLRPPPLRTLTYAFRSLRIRNYRLFWVGYLVSLAGTWMQDIALSWLVLSLTDSPAALGLTMTIRFLPALVFSLYGGVLADRLPKRRTILVAQSIQLVVALVLAVLTSTELVTLALIYVLAGIRGLADSVESPARQAFVPEMVGTIELGNAVALNSMLFNAARIAGPAIGAVVISTLGMAACFYINAVTFVAAIGSLLAMRVAELYLVPRPPRDSTWSQLREGFRYVRATPEVVVIFIVVGMIGAFGYNFQTLLPLVTKYILGAGASTLAAATTTMGAGSVVAGLLVAYRGKASMRMLLGAAGIFVVLLLVIGLSTWSALTMVLLFLSGFVGVLFMTTANTRLQLGVPDHLRGRVMGIYVLLFIGTTPIGSYLIGFLAENLSSRQRTAVQATVLCMAGLCAAGVVIALIYGRIKRSRTAD